MNGQALASALVHFLWQGILLWALAAMAFRLARAASPGFRCGLGLAFMGLALALPLGTWAWLSRSPILVSAAAETRIQDELPALILGQPRIPWPSAHPWILGAWALGAAIMALRLLGGWLWLQRLKARMLPLGEAWETRIRALARRMGLGRPFRTGISPAITSPMVLGWIRPVLLLPAGLIAGMDPGAVEALLAHEVAHLLRRDALFNALQCAVEVLLFYHPAVWWLSRRVRLERECACDDAAVALSGDARAYAETLNRLDDFKTHQLALAQGAHGGNLMYRITRLLTPKAAAPHLPLALPLAALLAAGAVGLAAQGSKPAKPETAASTAQVHQSEEHAPAKPKAAPAKATEDKAKEDKTKEYPATNRSIHFYLWVSKSEGTMINLFVVRATRAEVEQALLRIETLIKTQQGENRTSEGKWELRPYKGSPEDLHTFDLKRVTTAEARGLF